MLKRFLLIARLFPLLIGVVLLTLTGCQQTSTSISPIPPPHIVMPSCSAALPLDTQQGAGNGIPTNIYSLLHFYPRLPSWIPSEFSWNSDVFMTPAWKGLHPGITPFFRAEYGIWEQKQPSRSIYGSRIVLALDESSTPIGPTTGILPSLQIHMQKTLKANNLSGIIYHVTSVRNAGNGLDATEVIWQSGGIFLRLSTVTQGKLMFQNAAYHDILSTSPALTDAALMQLLQSIESYSTCH